MNVIRENQKREIMGLDEKALIILLIILEYRTKRKGASTSPDKIFCLIRAVLEFNLSVSPEKVLCLIPIGVFQQVNWCSRILENIFVASITRN
jgi:hypothetical protein